ncbi:MAG: polysaccharide biosynthesis/export family protein [Planctomycetota bacterium]|jgi:polysaccharide export outer membrane protein
MLYKATFLKIILLTFIVCLAGCFSSNANDIEAFVRPSRVSVTAEGYILQPPDEIEVYCSKVPEIHLQRQRIRPDGKVTFETLGEIYAAGKTPKELAAILHEKILSLYALTGENPIDVRVAAYRSKVFYVLGQVYLPGAKSYTGRDTVLNAVAKARVNPMAWLERIQVIRPSADINIQPKIFEVNFKDMTIHGDISKDVLLEEGDIIYVPPTIIAKIALTMEEFLRPIGRAFSTINIVQGPPQYRD